MPSFGDNPVVRALGVLDAGRSAEAKRADTVRVAVVLDPEAPAELVRTIRDSFVPEQPTGLVHVARLETGAPVAINPSTDVAIVVAGGSDGLCGPAASSFAAEGIPCAIVAETAVAAPDVSGMSQSGLVSLVAGSTRVVLLDKLGRWLCDVSDKDLALAACFPFVRRPKALQVVEACSAENAGVAALPFLNGADFPIMTANEAKMALEIAAVYGQDLTLWRVPELAGVVAGAFGLRGVARRVTGLLPGFSWLSGVGVGYAGAQAIGRALVGWFELSGDDQRSAEVRSRVGRAAGSVADAAQKASEGVRALPARN